MGIRSFGLRNSLWHVSFFVALCLVVEDFVPGLTTGLYLLDDFMWFCDNFVSFLKIIVYVEKNYMQGEICAKGITIY